MIATTKFCYSLEFGKYWHKEFWGCFLLMQKRVWLIMSATNTGRRKQLNVMSRVSPFFYLGHLGREFLVLIACFSCSTGSGYPKITLPGTRVEEGTFLLLTEIHLFLFLQKLSWNSFNCPKRNKYSPELLDPSRITKILKESSMVL